MRSHVRTVPGASYESRWEDEEDLWSVNRCRGLLVCETFDDLNIDTDSLYTGTRCLNCGCIEDAVIRANRSRRLATMRRNPSGRGRMSDIEHIKVRSEAYASIR